LGAAATEQQKCNHLENAPKNKKALDQFPSLLIEMALTTVSPKSEPPMASNF
jgi:hypothetical protein